MDSTGAWDGGKRQESEASWILEPQRQGRTHKTPAFSQKAVVVDLVVWWG